MNADSRRSESTQKRPSTHRGRWPEASPQDRTRRAPEARAFVRFWPETGAPLLAGTLLHFGCFFRQVLLSHASSASTWKGLKSNLDSQRSTLFRRLSAVNGTLTPCRSVSYVPGAAARLIYAATCSYNERMNGAIQVGRAAQVCTHLSTHSSTQEYSESKSIST